MTLLWLLLGAGIAGGIGWWIWRETKRQALNGQADLCDRYRNLWAITNDDIRREGTKA